MGTKNRTDHLINVVSFNINEIFFWLSRPPQKPASLYSALLSLSVPCFSFFWNALRDWIKRSASFLLLIYSLSLSLSLSLSRSFSPFLLLYDQYNLNYRRKKSKSGSLKKVNEWVRMRERKRENEHEPGCNGMSRLYIFLASSALLLLFISLNISFILLHLFQKYISLTHLLTLFSIDSLQNNLLNSTLYFFAFQW